MKAFLAPALVLALLSAPVRAGQTAQTAPAAWSARLSAMVLSSPSSLPAGFSAVFASLAKTAGTSSFDAQAGPLIQALAATGVSPAGLPAERAKALIEQAVHAARGAERAQAALLISEALEGKEPLSADRARAVESALIALRDRPFLGPQELSGSRKALAAVRIVLERERQKTLAHAGAVAAALGDGRRVQDVPNGGSEDAVAGAESSGARLEAYTGERDDAKEKRVERAPLPEPKPVSKVRRYGFLAGVLGLLLALPAAVNAQLPAGINLDLPAVSHFIWPLAAFALAALRVALAVVTVRMAPSDMGPDDNGLEKKKLPALLVLLAFAAAMEELGFRAMMTPFVQGIVSQFVSLTPAAMLAAATFLTSAIFAVSHKGGEFWSRVIGGAYYTALYVMSGSLVFAALTHFLFNLIVVLGSKTSAGRRLNAWATRRSVA